MNWKYNLGEDGKLLRKYIEEEKSAEIIEQLQKCYQFILKNLSMKDMENHGYRIEEAYSLLEGEADTIRNNPDEVIEEWSFDDLEDLINGRLEELYDICDSIKCWVEL